MLIYQRVTYTRADQWMVRNPHNKMDTLITMSQIEVSLGHQQHPMIKHWKTNHLFVAVTNCTIFVVLRTVAHKSADKTEWGGKCSMMFHEIPPKFSHVLIPHFVLLIPLYFSHIWGLLFQRFNSSSAVFLKNVYFIETIANMISM